MSLERASRGAPTPSSAQSSSGALLSNPPTELKDHLEPCAATASLFLFAQGSTIVSLHHDSLTLDRRFQNHRENVQFIEVDNVSERGAGRLVVSYDKGQTAIIWDLFTGQEVTRFASFEPIRVAAWMRNGHVAFGNIKGEIILFEPSTSEHVSARTIFDPITALAPATDCQSFAIGYLNGSILIATLQPSFTILHTLTTSRGPSPIISLAWHASSTKQRSDMLASQTVDGDLFVWSVAKQSSSETPRVIRALKRAETSTASPKWLAWSKNGRVIQHNDGETLAWDVRTKNVTYELLPTVEGVKGFANYGPTATLFTLGPNHTVQQYDVTNPTMVANTQHFPVKQLDTPIDPFSNTPPELALTAESLAKHTGLGLGDTEQPFSSDSTPTYERTADDIAYRGHTSMINPYGHNKTKSNGSGSRHRHTNAPYSKSTGTGTTFSTSSPGPSIAETLSSGFSTRYDSAMSTTSGGSSRRPSRLRNEVVREKKGEPIAELFPFTRGRMNSVPFNAPRRFDDPNLGPDELRKQMLNVVFGWEGDIEQLIRDEFVRHPSGSRHSVILARWLSHIDPKIMLPLADTADSQHTAWMVFALSQLSSETKPTPASQSLVKRLLSKGDIHSAVAVLVGMGEDDTAVELYVSGNRYMEAILLTCLLMPSEWTRQSYLVRKWGENVVQNSQQHLAARCFSCTDTEPVDPWASQSTQMAGILSSHLANRSPPPQFNAPQPSPGSRLAVKNQSLKLITSFGSSAGPSFKFPGLGSADRTPTNVPGVTPIDSALGDSIMSPGGFGYHRQGGSRSIGQSISARSTPASHTRGRLPSIGETPDEVAPGKLPIPKGPPTPEDSASGREKDLNVIDVPITKPGPEDQLELLTSARYTPRSDSRNETPATAVQHEDDSLNPIGPFEQPERGRNGSRERKPEGLQIQWPPQDGYSSGDYDSGPYSASRHHTRDKSENAALSPSISGMSNKSAPSVSSRSINEYISSLDGATYLSQKQRAQKKQNLKVHSKDGRGRSSQRYIQPAKRSPSSPIPMSPDDIALFSTSSKEKSGIRPSSEKRGNRRLPSASPDNRSRASRRSRSRRRDYAYGLRSPSSPVPMTPARGDEENGDDAENKLRLVNVDRKQRYRSKERSKSRRPERGTSAQRTVSPDRRRVRERDRSSNREHLAITSSEPEQSNQNLEPVSYDSQQSSLSAAEDLIKKKQAAAELEARRRSLARRPSAPSIPLPGDMCMTQLTTSRAQSAQSPPPPVSNGSFSQRVMSRNNESPPTFSLSDLNTINRSPCAVPVGLPATPRAMMHPKYSAGYTDHDAPAVPDIPPANMPREGQGRSSVNIRRSMSAPIPDDEEGIPTHPYFQRQLPSSRTSHAVAHKRGNSGDASLRPGVSGGGAEAGRKGSDAGIPPLLPELQHLHSTQQPPPPPPPPGPPAEPHRGSEHSEGRNSLISGVGTINIAIDDSQGPAVFGDPSNKQTNNNNTLSSSIAANTTVEQQQLPMPPPPPPQAPGGSRIPPDPHRRGRSVNENFTSKFQRFTDRMRSTSRGNNGRSPPAEHNEIFSPYESVSMPNFMENRV